MINIKMTHQNSSSDASKTAVFLCVPFFRLIRLEQSTLDLKAIFRNERKTY